jgi:hypothetical protein
MAPRERRNTEEKTQRIVQLLSETEMTIPQIAARMQCSRSVVYAINLSIPMISTSDSD